MPSSKKEFIQALKAAIVPILEEHGGGTFAGWNGQIDLTQRHNPISLPAVFWEIVSIPWRNVGDKRGGTGQYTKEGVLNLHVALASMGEDPHIDDNAFDLADEIAAAAFKVNGERFGSVYRTEEVQDTTHEQVVTMIETFRFGIADDTTFVNKTQEKTISTIEFQQNFET